MSRLEFSNTVVIIALHAFIKGNIIPIAIRILLLLVDRLEVFMHPLGQGLIEMGLVLVVLIDHSLSEVWVVVKKVAVGYQHGMFALVDDNLRLTPVLANSIMLEALDEVGELLANVLDEHLFILPALNLHLALVLIDWYYIFEIGASLIYCAVLIQSFLSPVIYKNQYPYAYFKYPRNIVFK